MTSESGARSERDRELFDATAAKLRAKDLAWPSRIARRHRLLQSLRSIPDPHIGALLEVGCGAGFAAPYLEGRYERFTGIDHSTELIKRAQQDHQLPGVGFEVADAADYQPEEKFSAILMIGVLHHLEEMNKTLGQLVSLLEPGGWIIANEPQPANPVVSLLRRARTRMDRDYSDEQEEIPRHRLRELFETSGLENVRVIPQGLFSTPFAEVVLRPHWLMAGFSKLACLMDRCLEWCLGRALAPLSWNLVAVGQKPGYRKGVDDE